MDVVHKEGTCAVVEYAGEVVHSIARPDTYRIAIHLPRQHRHFGKEEIVGLSQPGLSRRMILARDQGRLKHEDTIEVRAATIVLRCDNASPQRIVLQYCGHFVAFEPC